MLAYIWPIGLAVMSNIVYHICSKSVPAEASPFAALTVTYLVSTVFSAVMLVVTNGSGRIADAFGKLNWAPFVLGIAIVGLEIGFMCAYKAGWQVSTASIVQSTFLSVALIVVGFLLFREAVTWNKLVGAAICLVGLVFINLK